MDTGDQLFLLARACMVALCAAAVIGALRRMAEPAEARQRAVLGLVALLLGIGMALAIHDSWDNLVVKGDIPVTFGSWLWLIFDLGVPVLTLRILRVMRERDAALAELARLSVTDPLTGLANRRGFEARAVAALHLARRQGTPCCVLAFDIDHFKAINDGWGHPAGDEVLRATAAALAAEARSADLLARLGGEEFAALVAGSDLRAAALAAERMRAAVSARTPHPGGAGRAVTLSCGVAELGQGEPAAALGAALARADAALYAAKRNGRDRVELAA